MLRSCCAFLGPSVGLSRREGEEATAPQAGERCLAIAFSDLLLHSPSTGSCSTPTLHSLDGLRQWTLSFVALPFARKCRPVVARGFGWELLARSSLLRDLNFSVPARKIAFDILT